MTLQDCFEKVLDSDSPLDELEKTIWEQLTEASRLPEHPWSLGAVATVSAQDLPAPSPNCRTVVLRQADATQRSIDFFTDIRSEKIRQIRSAASVCWLMYDRESRIQLRLDGTATVIDDDEADRAWENTPLHSRAAYLSLATPGKPTSGETPPDTQDRFPTEEESERGRKDFRIVRTHVERIDWLYLRRSGHVRANIECDVNAEARSFWVVP